MEDLLHLWKAALELLEEHLGAFRVLLLASLLQRPGKLGRGTDA